jgi:hypothetical protein
MTSLHSALAWMIGDFAPSTCIKEIFKRLAPVCWALKERWVMVTIASFASTLGWSLDVVSNVALLQDHLRSLNMLCIEAGENGRGMFKVGEVGTSVLSSDFCISSCEQQACSANFDLFGLLSVGIV